MGAQPPVAEVDGHGFRFPPGVFARGVELYDDARVLDDDGPASGGPVRVERDERAARLEHSEQSDHHFGGAFQGDPDDVFCGESAGDRVQVDAAMAMATRTPAAISVGHGRADVRRDHGDVVADLGQHVAAAHLFDARAEHLHHGADGALPQSG
ncbi:hypothetical protein SVIOM342S_09697 [Streptomyces violaceorubidus]